MKPEEIRATQFYIHNRYINTYYKVYEFLNEYISKLIFRNDSSRVFLASNEYAFRRRFELVDPSLDYNKINASELNFPFANYWPQNTGWVGDTRIAANTAALVYAGIYEGTTKINAAASIMSIPVRFYFNREDDARLAYERLYFNSFNEHYYSTTIHYGGETLGLPVNIKISSLVFNPQFKESDWLKQNRIFIIDVTLDCRSYALSPVDQPDYKMNVISDDKGNLKIVDNEGYVKYLNGELSKEDLEGYENYKDGIKTSEDNPIVDDVILNFGVNNNYIFETYPKKENFPTSGRYGVIYVDSYISDTTKLEIENKKILKEIDKYVWNGVEYIKLTPFMLNTSNIRYTGSILESGLYVNFLKTTTDFNNATISWEISKISEGVDISEIRISISNSNEIVTLNGTETSYTIHDLEPNSFYVGSLTFYTSTGESKMYEISFNTKESTIKKDTKNSLVGITW